MKIRNGFVSNSSSSSFVCDICGASEVIYDGEGGENYLNCEHGHSLCATHVKNQKKTVEQLRQLLIDDAKGWMKPEELERETAEINEMSKEELEEAWYEVNSGELLESECPICSFKTLTNDDLMDYLLMVNFSTKKHMIGVALSNYKSYKEFQEAIKLHKKAMKEQGK